MGDMQPEGGQTAMATESAARRFYLASPATWVAVLCRRASFGGPSRAAPAGQQAGSAARHLTTLIRGDRLPPLGRDQPDNAARVVHAGAGIRLRKNASVSALRAAVARVIEDPRYRAAARTMAARLDAERDDNCAVDELERVAAGLPATGAPTRP